MIVNEDNKTVTVTKLYMHRHMKNVWDMISAGYEVIVVGHGTPIARISGVTLKWDGKGLVQNEEV